MYIVRQTAGLRRGGVEETKIHRVVHIKPTVVQLHVCTYMYIYITKGIMHIHPIKAFINRSIQHIQGPAVAFIVHARHSMGCTAAPLVLGAPGQICPPIDWLWWICPGAGERASERLPMPVASWVADCG